MKNATNHFSLAISATLAAVLAAAAVATPSVASAREAVTYLDYVTVPSGAYAFLTDVKPEGDWKIKVDFASSMTGTFGLFCCNDSNDSYKKRLNLYHISGSGNGWRLDVNHDSGTGGNGGLSGVNVKLNVRQTVVYDAGKVFLDGTQIIDRSSDVTGVTSANAAPIALFANNSSKDKWVNFGEGRIYGAQIWNGEGTLVRDLRPCRTAAGVAALYDGAPSGFPFLPRETQQLLAVDVQRYGRYLGNQQFEPATDLSGFRVRYEDIAFRRFRCHGDVPRLAGTIDASTSPHTLSGLLLEDLPASLDPTRKTTTHS